MLILLEESEKESHNINILSHNKQDFGFSDGFTDLNVQSVPFLKDRSINLVCFSQSNCYQILTVHQPSSEVMSYSTVKTKLKYTKNVMLSNVYKIIGLTFQHILLTRLV